MLLETLIHVLTLLFCFETKLRLVGVLDSIARPIPASASANMFFYSVRVQKNKIYIADPNQCMFGCAKITFVCNIFQVRWTATVVTCVFYTSTQRVNGKLEITLSGIHFVFTITYVIKFFCTAINGILTNCNLGDKIHTLRIVNLKNCQKRPISIHSCMAKSFSILSWSISLLLNHPEPPDHF